MTPTAERSRAYRARKRAKNPRPAPVDRATVGSLEQQRDALNIPGPELSVAVGKDRDWWRRIVRGTLLYPDLAAKVQAELTAAFNRVNAAFKETSP